MSDQTIPGPFVMSPALQEQMAQAGETLKVLETQVAGLKQAGADVSALETMILNLKASREALVRNFGPR
jgi:methionine synthase I (cobalamin-dependent)